MTDTANYPSKRHEPNRIPLEIAVLGGGFAGVFCAKEISKHVKKKGLPRTSYAIVSNQNYMVFQPLLAEVAGASLSPQHVVNPIRLLCRNISVFKGEVKSIDLQKKEVLVDTGHFSTDLILEFKHLVLAMGAEIDLSRVPGMPEHALLMQNVGDAMILRSTIISRIEEANSERRDDVRQRLLTFVVVGGGYSGVETAGEILDLVKGVGKYYRRLDPKEFRVVLVHSRDIILNNLDPDLGSYAGMKLKDRGLELCLEERVRAVTATRVYLQSGEIIETNTVVSTVGNAPNRVIQSLCDQNEIEHDRYWIKTDSEMRVPGYDFLWAAGDCAAVPFHGEEGRRCPQTAQFASRQGPRVAKNLMLTLEGKQPQPFTFTGLGELASIGHRTAVAKINGIQFSGIIAWFMWRSIYLSKMPGFDRKLRIIIEWTLDLFFPRDINLLNPRYSNLYRNVHLEQDDYLFTSGEPAFSLYVVREGEIQLKDPDGSVVRSIQPGDYFGERAIVHGGGYIYDAVATEATELFSVSGELILPFFRTSRRLRQLLAKTTTQHSAEAELSAICSKMDDSILDKDVSEIMHTDVAFLRSDQTVRDAIELFNKRRFSVYPLVSDEEKLIGALSREDFFNFIKKGDVNNETPLDRAFIMHLPTCNRTTSVKKSLELMIRSGNNKCLITNEENRLEGIVTVMDLISKNIEKELEASKATS